MKLRALTLYQFGRHNGSVLPEIHDGLTVVYGPNEAGKSTLLAGIRGLLFGKVSTAEGSIEVVPGAHGSLRVEDEQGKLYIVERALHRKSPPKIRFEDGQVVSGEEVFRSILPELGAVEASIYSAIFSFQLAELRDVRDTDKSLQSRIYTVGMFGGLSPFQLEEAFRQSAREIYNPDKRARNASLIQCLQTIDGLREQIRLQDTTPRAFSELKRTRDQMDSERAAKAGEIHSIRVEREKLDKYLTAYPIQRRVVELRERLEAFSTIPYVTQDQIRAVEHWKSQIARLDEEVTSGCEIRDRLQRSMDDLHIDLRFVELAPRFTGLKAESSGGLERLRQIEEKDRELADLEHSIQQLRQSLSPEWTEARISAVDLSDAVLNAAAEADEKVSAIQSDIETLKRQLITQGSFVNQKIAMLGNSGEGFVDETAFFQARDAVDQRLHKLLEDEERIDDIQRAVERLMSLEVDIEAFTTSIDNARQGKSGSKFLLRWLWLGTAVLFCLGLVGAAKALWIGMSVAAMSVVLAAMLVSLSRARAPGPTSKLAELQLQVDRKRAEYAQCMESLHRASALLHMVHLELGANPREAELNVQQVKRELREMKLALDRERVRIQHSLDLLQELAAARAEQSRMQNELASLEEACSRELALWRAAVTQRGALTTCETPAGFLREAKLVRDLRNALEAHHDKRNARNMLRSQIVQYLRRLELCLTEATSPTQDEVAAAAEETIEAHEELREAFQRLSMRLDQMMESAQIQTELWRERERRAHELELVLKQLNVHEEQLATLHEQVLASYQSIGVETDAEFERMIEAARERDDMERQLRETLIEVYTVFGGREAYEQQGALLNQHGAAWFDEELQRLTAREADLAQQFDELNRAEWEIEARLKAWQDGVDALNLAFQYEQAQTEKKELALQWAAYTIAQVLARQARETYERTRQPEALRIASEVFHDVTNGKYKQIRASVSESGKPSLFCVDDKDISWPLEQLSRGAREQVYLALRFALIRDYAARGISLPVVLDDPMVNFDDRRMEAYFRFLVAEANHQQMLYLTCHPEIVSFARAHKGVHVVTLSS